MTDKKQKLLNELTEQIEKRHRYTHLDFQANQILLWTTIASSFLTAIVAVIDAEPWITASLASLSGSLILVDKYFTFSKRQIWNCVYRIKLEKLYRDLEYKNVDVSIIADQWTALDEEMEKNFPNVDFKVKTEKGDTSLVATT
ncbi:MAG TPA: hypothetical protein VD794_08655 [Flavisolibacter sp.]|nr:hypothetical protein [Flavisolibacter sp.]